MDKFFSAIALTAALLGSAAAADQGATSGTSSGAATSIGTPVRLETLPPAVKSSVVKEASAQEIQSIRLRNNDGGKMVYDVEVRRGEKTEIISYDDQGKEVERKAPGAMAQPKQ